MKRKFKKSEIAGILFGIAMAFSFSLTLGPVGIALGIPFAVLGKEIFRELDKKDKEQ